MRVGLLPNPFSGNVSLVVRFMVLLTMLAVVIPASPAAIAGSPLLSETRALALGRPAENISIGIVGDSLAYDLWKGMRRLLAGNADLKISNLAKHSTGLIRDDYFDWETALPEYLDREKPDVVAVMIGGNDRQTVRIDGRRLVKGTKAWLEEYERRVSRFMSILKQHRVKVFWLGLPIVSSDRMNYGFAKMNAIFRRQAGNYAFTYIDTWHEFDDDNGNYSSFGPSVDGVQRRLRKQDGMHFTDYGKLRLADTLTETIKRELGKPGVTN